MHHELVESSGIFEVVEGLAEHGDNKWSVVDVDNCLAARRLMAHGVGYNVYFEVIEVECTLELIVKSSFFTISKASKTKTRNLAVLLERVAYHNNFLMRLDYVAEDEVWFIYPWVFNQAIQDALTLPALCHMLEGWAVTMSEPIVALAPLVHKYLSGQVSAKANFSSEAEVILDFLDSKVAGHA
ncbi:MAG: hypothetical protein WDZ56_00470 [Candidatus Paceibacterota bacterium]